MVGSKYFVARDKKRAGTTIKVKGHSMRLLRAAASKEFARERAGELAQIHLVLRKAVSAIASETDISRLVERFLLEVTAIAGAAWGGLAMRLDATHLQQIAHVEHGAVVPASVWNRADRIDPHTGALLDLTGSMAEQLKGAEIIMRTDPPDPLIPRHYLPYLRANGIKFQWSLPMWQGDEVLGVFTLGFAQNELADNTAELVRSLAHQATLAIRLNRLGEENRSREILLARTNERELLARRRDEERERHHLALRKSLSSIASETNPQSLVEKFLLEATAIVDAVIGGLSMRVDATHFRQIAHVHRGAIVPAKFWSVADHIDQETGFLRDPAGRMAALLEGNELFMPTEPLHRFVPREHLPYLRDNDIQLQWSLPMCIGDEVIGGFTLGFSRRDLTESTMELVRAFSHQITLAIRLNRASEESRHKEAQIIIAREREEAAQRQTQELLLVNEELRVEIDERQKAERVARGRTSALTQVLNGLTGAHSLDETMDALLNTVISTLSGSGGIFWRYEQGSSTVVAEAVSGAVVVPGKNIGSDLHPRIRLKTTVVDSLSKLGALHYDTDIGIGDAEFDGHMQSLLRAGTKRILSVPIRFHDQTLGAFAIYNPQAGPNHEDNLYLASALADQAALAMQLRELANIEKEDARVAAIDAERTRFARDLHDTLAQGLSGIVIHLQASLRSPHADKSVEHVERAIETAKQSLIDIRRAVRALRNECCEGDLPANIGALLKSTFIGSSILYDVQIIGTRFLLAASTQDEIFRIVQEVATNALTHSGATRFQAILSYTEQDFSLTLVDNGRGFRPNAQHDGFGVIGVKERAKKIASDFSFESAPGGPTRVALYIQSCAVELNTADSVAKTV